jgi:hypothetical protein
LQERKTLISDFKVNESLSIGLGFFPYSQFGLFFLLLLLFGLTHLRGEPELLEKELVLSTESLFKVTQIINIGPWTYNSSESNLFYYCLSFES